MSSLPLHRLLFALALGICGNLGCKGPGAEPLPAPEGAAFDLTERDFQAQSSQALPIGFYLTELDARLRAWNNLKLAGRSPEDQRKLRLLEQGIRLEAESRQEELAHELESGPPSNRAVAALALGFSGSIEAQSPLLAALQDSDDQVVNNALIGLGELQRADTPLAPVCYLLRAGSDGWTRTNAAFALHRIVGAMLLAGSAPEALDPCAVEGARAGLFDLEGGVRVQCAALLGMLGDTDSIPALADLLEDEMPLVSAAAASALREIGSKSDPHKGSCARALLAGFERNDKLRAERIQTELARLAGRNYGRKADDWREWAYKMP